jgi:hypothetical protein
VTSLIEPLTFVEHNKTLSRLPNDPSKLSTFANIFVPYRGSIKVFSAHAWPGALRYVYDLIDLSKGGILVPITDKTRAPEKLSRVSRRDLLRRCCQLSDIPSLFLLPLAHRETLQLVLSATRREP